MDLFKNRIQPTIVHISNNTDYVISNKYLLNYNVVQIDWFKNNSLVLEDGMGIVLLETSNTDNPLSASSNDAMFLMNDETDPDKGVLDLPRIFFLINDNFIDANGNFYTPDVINSFIISLLQLSDSESAHTVSNIIGTGNTYNGVTILPGVDYFINKTLADYLISNDLGIDDEGLLDPTSDIYNIVVNIRKAELPNYLNDNSDIKSPWVSLTSEELNITDFEYFYNLNIVNDYNISEDDIRNFYPTFCKVILDANSYKSFADVINVRYKAVLEYFANSKTDTTSQMINLILGSVYSGSTVVNTASSLCNCGNKTNSPISTCASLYSDAMLEYLKQMLGASDFYYNWFFENKEPNYELIRCLKYLISQFLSLNLDLSFVTSDVCVCKNADSSKSNANYDIIRKYDKVLSWVRSCEIPNNINKIKLYGSQFGELLPKLQF